MTKSALVVGINDYSAQGQSNLSFCVNDADAMYHLLNIAFGFDQENIILLKDARATRRNIMSALTYLLSNTAAGDTVCFFYAGHGGIMPATANSDNTRFYEAIIPYLGEWIFDLDLDELLRTSGVSLEEVNFTVILDSCHSGGISRTDIVEQSIPRTVPFDPIVMQGIQNVQTWWPFGICLPSGSNEILLNVSNPRLEQEQLVDLDEDPNKTLVQGARATLLAACKYYELAGEHPNHQHGFFTQAFIDIINSSNFNISYTDIIDELVTRVRTLSGDTQTPQLRGQFSRSSAPFLAGWQTSVPS